ncbi:MAG: hypothetical protein MR006_00990 [Arcanobacterium sp.]|nr:hypothetical protein [Arcanobacterium sp.]MDY5589171.1 hypothetical protein [Arcanobacterium sp.]
MGSFTATNGQMMTDKMMADLESIYAAGEFPPDEYSVGEVIHGTPRSLSPEGSSVLSVKVPLAMKRAIQAEAERENTTPSTLVRSIIARHMIET